MGKGSLGWEGPARLRTRALGGGSLASLAVARRAQMATFLVLTVVVMVPPGFDRSVVSFQIARRERRVILTSGLPYQTVSAGPYFLTPRPWGLSSLAVG